ncbi:U3 small nucleolar ribonucleoprotein IMP3 [Salpingoeca rosetta]|uniref:U3 small nucleolar ribonucleoprotein protein IMP3 n=1 Tax=Salpingoeca rosetta (strain ATCC 50818 / BSB-021) TaxID=946362 RepID=F2TWE9_SALR5|nr:U3 small nucleolar ribonucleoprotein IMP3 [Salpingoeca rosetta]EGD72395.1 U3 small nucleolar ribonucleoprotein IMP3 [Salpingoeca rosetta]|eukprot:XP_004998964.1 U3 small nucleolar ribonucleoprotein IMP3 [Salpingoeca rosetta]
MRKLRHHEKKLLRKVDFYDKKLRAGEIMRRYHIQNREDYTKYNRLAGKITKLVAMLRELDPNDKIRQVTTDHLLTKLYAMGVLTNKTTQLSDCEQLSTSRFCARRLPVVMVRLKMAQTVKEAVKLVEQGHVRVGPDPVTDPAYLVTRQREDLVTWVDNSKIRRHVLKYNDKLDDFDLL